MMHKHLTSFKSSKTDSNYQRYLSEKVSDKGQLCLTAPDIHFFTKDAVVSIDCQTNARDPNTEVISSYTNSGSGFFIRGHYIITAAHVVMFHPANTAERVPASPLTDMVRYEKIFVTVNNVNGKKKNYVYDADLIGVDGAGDIAVLKINSTQRRKCDLPKVKKSHPYFGIGNSRKYYIGRKVFVIGNPLGIDSQSISQGIVRDNRYFNRSDASCSAECVLTDADCLTGNSGSPLISEHGRVIAMMTLSMTDNEGNTMAGGISSYFMKYVISAIISTYKDPDNKCYGEHGEIVLDSVGPYVRYRKGYMGLMWRSFDASSFALTSKYRRPGGIVLSGIDVSSPVYQTFKNFLVYNSLLTPTTQHPDYGVTVLVTKINNFPIGESAPQISPSIITWTLTEGDCISLTFRLSNDEFNKEWETSLVLGDYPYILDRVNVSGNYSLLSLNNKDNIDVKSINPSNLVTFNSYGAQTVAGMKTPVSSGVVYSITNNNSSKNSICIPCLEYGYTCASCSAVIHNFVA